MSSLPDWRDGVPRQVELPDPCPKLIWDLAERLDEPATWRKVFPGTADRVTDARRLAGLFLDDTPHADDAAWIIGELAANAVRHTASGAPGGRYVLELSRTPRTARLAVYDLGGGGRPTFAHPVPRLALAEGGYGLRTIAHLANRAGIRGNPATGHVVWADLPLGG